MRDIFKRQKGKLPPYQVESSTLGETIFVKCPSYRQTLAIVKAIDGANDASLPEILAGLLCDETGTLIYDKTKPEDLDELADLDTPLFVGLLQEVIKTITPNNAKIEDAKKN